MDKYPVFIGGIGGSGTRALVLVLEKLGLSASAPLNDSLDYQWFAYLFKQKRFFTLENKPELGENTELLKHIVQGKSLDERDWALFNSKAQRPIHPFLQNYIDSTKPEPVRLIKEPNTIYFLPELSASFVKSRFILLMRHPLEMVLSENQQQLTNWGKAFNISTPLAEVDKLRFWMRVHQYVIKQLEVYFPDRHLILRYNDLGNKAEQVLTKLNHFLDTPHVELSAQEAMGVLQYKAKAINALEKRLPVELVDEALALFDQYV